MAGYIGETKYLGPERIVVAMDIGTTHSAVSFAYLYPDSQAQVRMVNKWPCQPEAAGSSKIPTLVAYRDGECKACGSEAREYEDETQYDVAKWFKLHLHPASMKVSELPPIYGSSPTSSNFEIPMLPKGVQIEQVYADFMKYLMENTQRSFEQGTPNGRAIWQRMRDTMLIIITTPNGWDLAQQNVLRKAAIRAGLVTDEKAHELLDFVTEGEASVHYALAYSQSKSWLFPGSMFAVIDAGGSTIDSTLYECKSTDPKVLLEEVCPSECIQAGGIFIDRAAEAMLRQKLCGSKFGDEDSIREMVEAFESRTKRIFDGSQSLNVVDFGASRDNDRAYGIIKGKMPLEKQEMETLFDDVVDRVAKSCFDLLGGRKVKFILLVGGFGESPYLQSRLGNLFERQGSVLVTLEEPAKKAAAEGALVWFVKQTVSARVARTTIGVKIRIGYEPGNPEHQERAKLVYYIPQVLWTAYRKQLTPELHRGGVQVLDAFSIILLKGQRMQADFTSAKPYAARTVNTPGPIEIQLFAWEGEGSPSWICDINGVQLPQIRELCVLRGDLSILAQTLQKHGPRDARHYRFHYKVVIRFGGTQLQARLQWKEGDTIREGPITIIPNAIL